MGVTANSLFGSIPSKDPLQVYVDGKPDKDKVLDVLNYSTEDVAVAANVSVKSVRYDSRMPKALYDRINEWALVICLVGNFFGDIHRTALWFQTVNPHLGDVSPAAMIRAGRFKKLLKFIQTALDENSR
jgi:hypothetical protein